MLLVRSKTGLIKPRMRARGAVDFNCGHIERFGTEDEPKQYCQAKLVDADTIQVTLPPWSLEQDV
jgi:hypothetical protein